MQSVKAQRGRGRLIVFPAAIAAAAAIAVACFVWWSPARHDTLFAEQAATEIGGLRNIDLPDGSLVTLNTNSAVDVQFTPAERRVRLLRGEAHFTVARNPHQPFIVESNGVAVRAVGTAFNVRRHTDAIEVFVTEGSVRVDDAGRGESLLALPAAAAPDPREKRVLTAGEKVVVAVRNASAPQPARSTTISADEIEQALAWQKRRLEYVDVPLSEIVADFNRYNQHRLVIPDARLSAQRFGGTFPAGDYESFVQLLESTFGVVVERRERETVLRLP
jgi:transmembrane sensor